MGRGLSRAESAFISGRLLREAEHKGRVLVGKHLKVRLKQGEKYKKLDKVNLNQYHNETIGIVRFCKAGGMTRESFITAVEVFHIS